MLNTIILAGTATGQTGSAGAEIAMQFEDAPGVKSRFRQVLDVLSSDIFCAPTVVSPLSCASLVSEQMSAEGQRGSLLIEPDAHKPAASIMAAVLRLKKTPDALVVIAPASAPIGGNTFDKALFEAIPAARRGEIAILSDRVDRTGTAAAMVEVATHPLSGAPSRVTKLRMARNAAFDGFFSEGHALWSTGVIVARVDALLVAFKRHANRIFMAAKTALAKACNLMDGLLLDKAAYRRVKPLSFELAVAAKSDNVVAVPLGTALSVCDEWDQDLVEETRGSSAAGSSHALDMLGLLANVDGQGRIARQDFHWGSRERLCAGAMVQRVTVRPGATVDMTSSARGAEHWIVVEGTALVSVGQSLKMILKHQSTRIPAGTVRRVENPGTSQLQLICLQLDHATDPTENRTAKETPSHVGAA